MAYRMGSMPSALAPANGIEIAYETYGDPADTPLLLVMGLGAQLIAWPIDMVHAFVDRGFFVVRYDNRDVGLSTKCADVGADFLTTFLQAAQGEPVEVSYRLTDMAADGMGLLDYLGIASAHVVGASMGGMIAQTMAIEYPTRVRSLTSIMSTTGEPEVGMPTPEAVAVLLRPVATTRQGAIDASVEGSRMIGSPAFFDEADIRRRAEAAYERCYNPAGVARQILAIAASGSRAEGLGQLNIPAVVIHGDLDPLVAPSGGQRTAELIPGARLIMIEGMGHDLPAAMIAQVVEAVTALASRVRA